LQVIVDTKQYKLIISQIIEGLTPTGVTMRSDRADGCLTNDDK